MTMKKKAISFSRTRTHSLVVGSLLDVGLAQWVDLRCVRAEPHEPHAHCRRPHNHDPQPVCPHSTKTKKIVKSSPRTPQQRLVVYGVLCGCELLRVTDPLSFMKGIKEKTKPATAKTSVAIPIEPQ